MSNISSIVEMTHRDIPISPGDPTTAIEPCADAWRDPQNALAAPASVQLVNVPGGASGVSMKYGRRVRALMLVLTVLMLASTLVSAQSEILATPDVEAPVEPPVVEETPTIEVTPEPDPVTPPPVEEDVVTPDTEPDPTAPVTPPESTPPTQSRSGDMSSQEATASISISLSTDDGGEAPTGTEVCVQNRQEPGMYCASWAGYTLTFEIT